ncbi:MAG TPA: hypothetical protein VF323_08090 [Candidatus Limnocylindrales bacterium]
MGGTVGAGVSETVGPGLATAAAGVGEAGTGVLAGLAVGLGLKLALAQPAATIITKIASGPTRRRERCPIQCFFIVCLASSIAARQP